MRRSVSLLVAAFSAAGFLVGPAVSLAGAAPAFSQTEPGTFVPVGPVRIMDTRAVPPLGAAAPAAHGVTHLRVAGRGGVPAVDAAVPAAAVVLNVTAVSPTAAGYLTAYPDTAPRPGTSNVNFAAHTLVANQVIVGLGSNGSIALYNGSSASLPVVVDVAGYYRAGPVTTPGGFTALPPTRLIDTQTAGGSPTAHAASSFAVLGHAGVPANVSAVVLDIAVRAPKTPGYLSVYAGPTRPATANLNFAARTSAVSAVTQVGADGRVSVYNGSATKVDLVVDVLGWFAGGGTAGAPGAYVPVTPARVLDTRTGVGASTPAARATARVTVAGHAGVPVTGAGAVQLSLAAVAPPVKGYLTAFTGSSRPEASNVNFAAGQTASNAVASPLGIDGTLAIYNGSFGATPLVADVFGYYLPVDVAPPGRVTRLVATATSSSVTLNWTNPTDADFTGVTIRRAAGPTPPATPTDGTLVADTSGATHSVDDVGLAPNTQYSYSLFAHDNVPNYAVAAHESIKTKGDNNCTTTWTGASSTAWTDAGNWTGHAAPSTSDWACIPASAPNTPVVISGSVSVLGMNNSGGLEVDGSLALTDPTRYAISPGRLVASGSISVTHELRVYGPLAATGLTLHGPGAVLLDAAGAVGAGTDVCTGGLRLTDGVTVTNTATLGLAAGAALVVDDGALLRNDGTVQLHDGSSLAGSCAAETTAVLVNDGTISVPSGTAAIAGWWRNAGTLTVTGSAALTASAVTEVTDTGVVNGAGTATLSGRVVAAPGTTGAVLGGVTLAGAELDGPTPITVPASAVVVVAPGVSACRGDLWLTGSATLTVAGTLSVSAGATVAIDTDGSTLVDHGVVQLRDGSSLGGSCATPTAAFENAADGTLTVPSGTASVAGPWQDAGTVTVAANAVLSLAAETDVVSGAVFKGAGRVDVDAAFVVPAGVTVPMTNLAGSGTLTLSGASGPGAIAATGTWDIGALTLSLPDLSPACGAGVTAITGGTGTGSWAAITSAAGSVPGTWTPVVTATSAGATYVC